MRVSMVIPSLGPGGAEKVMSLLACEFVAGGIDTNLVTVLGRESDDFYSVPGVSRVSLNLGGASQGKLQAVFENIKRLRALLRTLRDQRPNVVISFLTEANILSFLAAKALRVPVVLSEHTDSSRYPLGAEWKLLRRLIYPFSDCVVVPNTYIAEQFGRRIRSRIQVIPNPIDTRHDIHRVERKSSEKVILTIGRMTVEKNHKMLLDAFARMRETVCGWKLVIVGDGPLRSETEAYTRHIGLEKDVHFPGLVSDPWAKYANECDIFVLCSDYEGFPMALCEAMSVGLPVISTRYHEGTEELITDGKSGMLVPVGDVVALASAMVSLAHSNSLRRSVGREATGIREKYGLSTVVTRWVELCERLIEKSYVG